MFDKDIKSYECQNDLIHTPEICGLNNCEAEYGEFNPYTKCSPDCIKQLDESMIKKKTRNRICKSEKSKCEKEDGTEEILFCENQSLCQLQRINQDTGGFIGKYVVHRSTLIPTTQCTLVSFKVWPIAIHGCTMYVHVVFLLSVNNCPNVTVEWTKMEGGNLLGPLYANIYVAVPEVILQILNALSF